MSLPAPRMKPAQARALLNEAARKLTGSHLLQAAYWAQFELNLQAENRKRRKELNEKYREIDKRTLGRQSTIFEALENKDDDT